MTIIVHGYDRNILQICNYYEIKHFVNLSASFLIYFPFIKKLNSIIILIYFYLKKNFFYMSILILI